MKLIINATLVLALGFAKPVFASAIYDELRKRTVRISTLDQESNKMKFLGTGFILENDTDIKIVTAGHVVKNQDLLYGTIGTNKDVHYSLEVLFSESGNNLHEDIAILSIPDSVINKSKEYGSCDLLTLSVEAGHPIRGIGYPWGAGFSVSFGNVGEINKDTGIIQTSGDFAKGMSGGPVVNKFGQLVGIILAGVPGEGSLNYVLSLRRILETTGKYTDKKIEPFCLELCESLAVKTTASCSASGKSGFHSSPTARCLLELKAPKNSFFPQQHVSVVKEHYRNIKGAPAITALKPIEESGLTTSFSGYIECTNAQGTGRTCDATATVEATAYPAKCSVKF